MIAGIAVAGLVIPESMGIAGVAGVEPQHGLYAALIALFLYAIFGSGRRSAVNAVSAMALLTATAIATMALTRYEDVLAAVVTITFLTGIILLIMAVLRIGWLANFISYPVVKGFLFGLSLTIIIGQVPKLLGVAKGEGNFFAQLWDIIGALRPGEPGDPGPVRNRGDHPLRASRAFQECPRRAATLCHRSWGLLYFELGVYWGCVGGKHPCQGPFVFSPGLESRSDIHCHTRRYRHHLRIFSQSVVVGDEVSERHNEEVDYNQELVAMAAANIGASFTQGIGTGVGHIHPLTWATTVAPSPK